MKLTNNTTIPSAEQIASMSDAGVQATFMALRFPETKGIPVCPRCSQAAALIPAVIGRCSGNVQDAAIIFPRPLEPCSQAASCLCDHI